MSTTYGVTASGFVAPTLTDIKTDLEAAFKAAFGQGIDVSPQSVFGQLIGIIAERLADLWDAGQGLYAAWTAEGATGVSLDNLCALTGTVRNPATHSTVSITLSGTNGTPIPAGSIVSVGPTGNRFSLVSPVTIGASPTAGVFQAVNSGPVIGVAGTLTYIATPVAGWTSATNALDAVLGNAVDSDAVLRLRREAGLRASGKGSVESIREAVLGLTDADGGAVVTSCTVFENVSDVTDSDGLPPHSVNVLATCATGAGIDAQVAASVFATKAAGIQTFGSASSVVTDSQGRTHTVNFDRPTELLTYVRLDLTIDPTKWPSDGVAQVQAALVAYGSQYLVTGKDVITSALGAQAFKVAGVLDSPAAKVALTPGPTSSANLTVTLRQIARLDTSRITVNTTPGTP